MRHDFNELSSHPWRLRPGFNLLVISIHDSFIQKNTFKQVVMLICKI